MIAQGSKSSSKAKMDVATSTYTLVIRLPVRYFSHVFLPPCDLV